MTRPFTLRVEGESITLSWDDGSTVTRTHDDQTAKAVLSALSTVSDDPGTRGGLTAATLGMLAEARSIDPVGGPNALVPEPVEGLNQGRIPLGPLAYSSEDPFDGVLARRRSLRTFEPMSLAELASILVPTSRVQSYWRSSDGARPMQTPTPSAGGRHPIDLIIAPINVEGIPGGLWIFDPFTCELVATPVKVEAAVEAVRRACQALEGGGLPAVAVFAVAHFGRTLLRYPGGASLVFRDVGALLAMLHLSATAARLASCILGTAGTLRDDAQGVDGIDLGVLVAGRHKID